MAGAGVEKRLVSGNDDRRAEILNAECTGEFAIAQAFIANWRMWRLVLLLACRCKVGVVRNFVDSRALLA